MNIMTECATLERIQILQAELQVIQAHRVKAIEELFDGRIADVEEELATLRVEALRRAGLPLPGKQERIRKIADTAARLFSVPVGAILGPTRTQDAFRARAAAMWVAQAAYGFSSTVIGREFGGRDHSSVLHAIKQAEQLRDTDQPYRIHSDGLLSLFEPKPTEAADATSSH